MTTTTKSDDLRGCQCEQAVCGCATPATCTCGERCECARVCRCANKK